MACFHLTLLVLSELKKEMFTQIEENLDTVDLPENHKFFIKLIKTHRMDIKQVKTIMPLNMIRKLVEANIIKEHKDRTVSFHSRYIETYFKEVILTENIAILFINILKLMDLL
ncbi:hypothetical protein C2G38_2151771 [Gigaspora rosea]|uniref:Uncharacterized protein n=1 Tax=Gigaspora rosea TaxID=44941 RepID=A0A397WCP4_9GLOM|nr:hypothetical protein C2G38_2151771 [Gigaspora rosea]